MLSLFAGAENIGRLLVSLVRKKKSSSPVQFILCYSLRSISPRNKFDQNPMKGLEVHDSEKNVDPRTLGMVSSGPK